MCDDIRGHILTTHSLKRLQEEMDAFMNNVSPSLRALVRSKIFSRSYEASVLARYMKTALYKEWLEINRTNAQLLEAGQPEITIEPVDERYRSIIDKLSRETNMDFKEPDT